MEEVDSKYEFDAPQWVSDFGVNQDVEADLDSWFDKQALSKEGRISLLSEQDSGKKRLQFISNKKNEQLDIKKTVVQQISTKRIQNEANGSETKAESTKTSLKHKLNRTTKPYSPKFATAKRTKRAPVESSEERQIKEMKAVQQKPKEKPVPRKSVMPRPTNALKLAPKKSSPQRISRTIQRDVPNRNPTAQKSVVSDRSKVTKPVGFNFRTGNRVHNQEQPKVVEKKPTKSTEVTKANLTRNQKPFVSATAKKKIEGFSERAIQLHKTLVQPFSFTTELRIQKKTNNNINDNNNNHLLSVGVEKAAPRRTTMAQRLRSKSTVAQIDKPLTIPMKNTIGTKQSKKTAAKVVDRILERGVKPSESNLNRHCKHLPSNEEIKPFKALPLDETILRGPPKGIPFLATQPLTLPMSPALETKKRGELFPIPETIEETPVKPFKAREVPKFATPFTPKLSSMALTEPTPFKFKTEERIQYHTKLFTPKQLPTATVNDENRINNSSMNTPLKEKDNSFDLSCFEYLKDCTLDSKMDIGLPETVKILTPNTYQKRKISIA